MLFKSSSTNSIVLSTSRSYSLSPVEIECVKKMEEYCNYLDINSTIYVKLLTTYYRYFTPDVDPILSIDWTFNIILLIILENNPKSIFLYN